jgi:hypothetical protein
VLQQLPIRESQQALRESLIARADRLQILADGVGLVRPSAYGLHCHLGEPKPEEMEVDPRYVRVVRSESGDHTGITATGPYRLQTSFGSGIGPTPVGLYPHRVVGQRRTVEANAAHGQIGQLFEDLGPIQSYQIGRPDASHEPDTTGASTFLQ